MVSPSMKRLEEIEKELTDLATIARDSDLKIIDVLNKQAVHIQNLSKLVISMHQKLVILFPEYAKDNTIEEIKNVPVNKPTIIIP